MAYLIGCLLAAFVIYRVYTSLQAKKQVGEIYMTGTSDYKSTGTLTACVILISGTFHYFEKNWMVWIIYFSCLAAAIFLSNLVGQCLIGELGLKVGNIFIPGERITAYRVLEKRVKEVELMVVGREQGIRLQIIEKKISEDLEDMLHRYVYHVERRERC